MNLAKRIAQSLKKTSFKDLPIDAVFSANKWGDGKPHKFVKRDKSTATGKEWYDKNGHTRGWASRTQFYADDAVKHIAQTKKNFFDPENHTKKEAQFSDFDREDMAEEAAAERMQRRRRNRFNCNDGFCGASDCKTCHPTDSEDEDED